MTFKELMLIFVTRIDTCIADDEQRSKPRFKTKQVMTRKNSTYVPRGRGENQIHFEVGGNLSFYFTPLTQQSLVGHS